MIRKPMVGQTLLSTSPIPLQLPVGCPVARDVVVHVRHKPDAPPHPRSVIEASGVVYLLLAPVVPHTERTRVWHAAVLTREDPVEEEAALKQRGANAATTRAVWTISHRVVIKESNLSVLGRYRHVYGEDPVAEVAALLQLQQPGHPGVIRPLAHFTGADNTSLWLVLPLLSGEDLYERIKSRGSRGVEEDEARAYVRGMCEALLYMKRRHGIRHGDVSPENFVFHRGEQQEQQQPHEQEGGEEERLVALDLGMAVKVRSSSRQPGSRSVIIMCGWSTQSRG